MWTSESLVLDSWSGGHMKSLLVHWLSTDRWHQVAMAPVSLPVTFFFKVMRVKGAPDMVWHRGNQLWACTPLFPGGLQGKGEEGSNIWGGWSLGSPLLS